MIRGLQEAKSKFSGDRRRNNLFYDRFPYARPPLAEPISDRSASTLIGHDALTAKFQKKEPVGQQLLNIYIAFSFMWF